MAGSSWRRPRVLITGGAGFIGSHLCRRYISKDWDVVCLDNLVIGRKSNISELLHLPNFEFIRHDIVDPLLLEADLVLNFACPASPVHYQANPIKTIKINTIGTMNMLGLALRCKARFVQASTSEVYGDPLVHPQPENYFGHVNPIGVRSCYDEGKRISETLCFEYFRSHSLDTRLIRIFNTYGPNMAPDDGRVVSNFILQALENKDISIYGDGTQTRSFCFVGDLVDGIEAIAEKKDLAWGPLNLGNDSEMTVMELASTVIKKANSSSQVKKHPLPSDDPKMRRPDLSKTKMTIAWSPKVDLERGLDLTIPYFQQELKRA